MKTIVKSTLNTADLDRLSINTIRFLSADAVQKANSGHPELPLGAAPMAYILWTKFLHRNPSNPKWFNPLGQGFGNGVGMAISEAYLAAKYNKEGLELIDHYTYGLVSDGDLMEGVGSILFYSRRSIDTFSKSSQKWGSHHKRVG